VRWERFWGLIIHESHSVNATLRLPALLCEPFELPPGFGVRWQAKRDTAFDAGLDHRACHTIRKRRRRYALPAQSKKSTSGSGSQDMRKMKSQGTK
jgi:hypothetical protein